MAFTLHVNVYLCNECGEIFIVEHGTDRVDIECEACKTESTAFHSCKSINFELQPKIRSNSRMIVEKDAKVALYNGEVIERDIINDPQVGIGVKYKGREIGVVKSEDGTYHERA